MQVKKVNWWYKITDIILDQYRHQFYLYYTRQESIQKFKEKYKQEQDYF